MESNVFPCIFLIIAVLCRSSCLVTRFVQSVCIFPSHFAALRAAMRPGLVFTLNYLSLVFESEEFFVPKAVFQVSELISQKLGIFNSNVLLFNQQRTQGKKLITAVKRKMYSLTLLHLGTSVFRVQQWGSGKTTLQLEISTVNRICTSFINLQAIGKIK